MKNIYQDILVSISKQKKLLAVLIDPDKMTIEMVPGFIKKVKKYNYVDKFIIELQSEGRYSFSLEELRQRFRFSNEAIKLSLKRLSQKGKIVSVRKGF